LQPLLQWKSNKYYICECGFVALGIQHAMLTGHISICGPPICTIFLHITSKRDDFREKSYWTQNTSFNFFYNFCLNHLSF